MIMRRWRVCAGLLALCVGVDHAARAEETQSTAATLAQSKPSEPAPRIFYTGPGQFEIVVRDVADAQPALALGRSVWDALAGPLGLPAEGFLQPVTVRLVPADQWTQPSVFTVTIENPGRVGVLIRWSAEVDPVVVRRAFVQGLILRQAAAWHGVRPELTVPLWLEQALTQLSMVREKPALLDMFQQESAGTPAVAPLRGLLTWERGAVESRDWELASLWLLLQLQAEAAGDFSKWGRWVRGVTGGNAPMETLPQCYPGLWSDFIAMDVWWQVGFHHQRRLRTLPVMTAEASRLWLADRSRWLAGRDGREVVLPLAELRELRDEPWVRAELSSRHGHVRAVMGVIHPYYANATLSLGKLYEAAAKGNEKQFDAARADFERDAVDGRDLEETVTATLNTAPRK